MKKRNRLFRRSTVSIAALVLLSLFVSGCGQGSQPSQPEPQAQPAPQAQTQTEAPPQQAEPVKLEGSVRVLVGFTPGGGVDTAIRGIQPYLEQVMGIPIVIENKGGAQGVIAAEEFAKADPDGHTLLTWGQPSAAIAQYTLKPTYNHLDFTPIFQIVGNDWRVVTVAADSPYQTLEELIEASKSTSVSAAITGSIATLQSAYLEQMGLTHRAIPFDSGSEGTVAVLGGHVDFCLDSTAAAAKYVQMGEMRVLAVHAPERVSVFPDAPTFAELGYEGMEIPFHVGVYGPPGMSEDLVKMFDEAFTKAAADPAFIEWANTSGVMIKPASSSDWKIQGEEWDAKIKEIAPVFEEGN